MIKAVCIPHVAPQPRPGVVIFHDAVVCDPLDQKRVFALARELRHGIAGLGKMRIPFQPKPHQKVHWAPGSAAPVIVVAAGIRTAGDRRDPKLAATRDAKLRVVGQPPRQHLFDHFVGGKPRHNVDEVTETVKRAKAAGKKALYRINRDLSLSRAIGDADLKPFGVIATPDVVVHRFKHRGDSDGGGVTGKLALVIASDGVWDTLSLSQCALLVQGSASKFEHLAVGASSLQSSAGGVHAGGENETIILEGPDANFAKEVARHIVETAQPGTNDDVTAVVAVFC